MQRVMASSNMFFYIQVTDKWSEMWPNRLQKTKTTTFQSCPKVKYKSLIRQNVKAEFWDTDLDSFFQTWFSIFLLLLYLFQFLKDIFFERQ